MRNVVSLKWHKTRLTMIRWPSFDIYINIHWLLTFEYINIQSELLTFKSLHTHHLTSEIRLSETMTSYPRHFTRSRNACKRSVSVSGAGTRTRRRSQLLPAAPPAPAQVDLTHRRLHFMGCLLFTAPNMGGRKFNSSLLWVHSNSTLYLTTKKV